MIDFRYHIVSLISVFLALAVGIVLGAGPLKEAIGDQLTGQVEALRTEKEELRVALDESDAHLGERDAFVGAVATDLLDGTLPGRRVALIELEPVDDAVLDGLTAQISSAGANVTVRGELTSTWVDDEESGFRQSLASSLGQYLAASDASTDAGTQLGTALVQAVTAIEPGDESAFSARAVALQELLVAGDLVVFDTYDEPVDMIVLVSAPPEVDADANDADVLATSRTNAVTLQRQLAQVAQAGTEASVVLDAGSGVADLVEAITADTQTATALSTVTDGTQLTSQITVPLALAARSAGTVGSYGPGPDATAPTPTIVRLGPVDREPRIDTADEPDGADAGDGVGEEQSDATEPEGADDGGQ
ncbi:MAG: copper transporter [Cellulomonadaceae bacterium]